MYHSAHGRSRGFTLVEILMVVVILGIAGAIIVPQLGSRDDLKARAAARIVMADLIYAQNLAITRQESHFVRFDGPAQAYALLAGTAMAAVTHPITKNAYVMRFGSGGSEGLAESALESATFTGPSGSYATIGFDELGTPLVYNGTEAQMLAGGAVVVRCGQFRLRVEVESFTGQIRVAEAP